MVLHHLRPSGMSSDGLWPTDRAIYRYFRDTGDVAIDTLYLAMADYLAAKGPELSHPDWLEHARMISHVLYTGTREPVSPNTVRILNGDDLMSHFQLQPGASHWVPAGHNRGGQGGGRDRDPGTGTGIGSDNT